MMLRRWTQSTVTWAEEMGVLMRNLLQFRIRTLLIAVAAIATLLVIGPRLWWRWRVHSALEATMESGPYLDRAIYPLGSITRHDYAYLLSDHERVSRRLFAIALSDDSYHRRANAIAALGALTKRAGLLDVRKQLLPDLITLACDSETPPSLTAEVAKTVGDWIPTTGVTIEERNRIRRKSADSDDNERIAWIKVLGSIGGRREVELLLEFGKSHDVPQQRAVCISQFNGILWPGILPHVDRWIHDPSIAYMALELSILSDTSAGRDLLLKLASDDSQPAATRTIAIEKLTQTIAGIDLLTSVCADDALASKVSGLLNANCREQLATERRKVSNRNGNELWSEFIEFLCPRPWKPTPGTTNLVEVEAQLETARIRIASSSLDWLRFLSGNAELATQDEWQSWYNSSSPAVVEQSALLQLLLDHPEMLDNPAVLRRVVPGHFGYIPDNCLPLYHQMLRSGDPGIRYWACQALLVYTDSKEAIHVAIDLIDQSPPSGTSLPGAIAMLQRRFAVNYFWDTRAWRTWARESQTILNDRGI